VPTLLAAGANPNIQLKLRPPYRNYIFDRGGDQVLSTGATPLLRAAKGGDVEAVRLLLKYKADFNLPTEDGTTPLMVAAGTGHGANPTRGRYKTDAEAAQCAALLIDAGADVNVADPRQHRTALHAAASHGWSQTVKLLADRGADLEFADSRGLRAIDHAAGRAERGFLEPEKSPNNETMQLLRELIVAKTGHEPVENKSPRPAAGGRGPANRNEASVQAQ
jgi:ankyrin repeat protein